MTNYEKELVEIIRTSKNKEQILVDAVMIICSYLEKNKRIQPSSTPAAD